MNTRNHNAIRLDRLNTTFIGNWWWTVDRFNFALICLLFFIGAVVITAASPPVASRLGYGSNYFVVRQYVFLFLGLISMLCISMLSIQALRRLCVIGFAGCVLFLMLLPFIGTENKGAIRWLIIAGISIQPSEFIKPCFAVVTAWMLSERYRVHNFPGFTAAIIIYGLVATLLIIQPDFGMTVTVSAMFGAQMVLGGLAFFWIILMLGLFVTGGLGAYYFIPHVHKRMNEFLDPEAGDNYQTSKALDAFQSGGLFGRGPGEGVVKWQIPDSHTDFIFAVVGEEFGIIVSIALIAVFAAIFIRGAMRILKQPDLFVLLAASGILVQFALQSIINMGVAVNMLPAKGMTLPLLSYGGSSIIAMSIGMGIFLGLTRKQYGGVKTYVSRYDIDKHEFIKQPSV
jgi:cell division protein FtsW